MKIVILLTGAANALNTPFSVSQSRDSRLGEYCYALNTIMTKFPDYNYVYIDSSGCDPRDACRNIKYNSNIEFLKTDLQHIALSRGKGSCEQSSIQYALKNSNSLAQADLILKINGRYVISNLNILYDDISKNFPRIRLFGSFKNNLTWFDSRCFAAPVETFVKLTEANINDFIGEYFEHALARICLSQIANYHYGWKMFDYPPYIIGMSGSTGKRYNNSFVNAYAKKLFHMLKSRIYSAY